MSNDESAVGDDIVSYRRLGHASVLLGGAPLLAVDPWRWREDIRVDAALVTHGHVDHCSEEDLLAALAPDAPIGAPAHLVPRLERSFPGRVVGLVEGDDTRVAGARVVALPSEGPCRGGRSSGFHPRGSGLAYLVEIPSVRALLLGDSVVLPEHEGWSPDVAFIAIGGMVTATPEEAAETAGSLGAGVVVPVHWGDLEARYSDAQQFVAMCAARGVTAAIAIPTGNGSAPVSKG